MGEKTTLRNPGADFIPLSLSLSLSLYLSLSLSDLTRLTHARARPFPRPRRRLPRPRERPSRYFPRSREKPPTRYSGGKERNTALSHVVVAEVAAAARCSYTRARASSPKDVFESSECIGVIVDEACVRKEAPRITTNSKK